MVIPQGTGLLTYCSQYLLEQTQIDPPSLKATASVLFHSVWVTYSKFLNASISLGEESHLRTLWFLIYSHWLRMQGTLRCSFQILVALKRCDY